jgi:cellulose synthase/poly-beta-1,6-N-acetylglucosamine synthase-like glycosyltransferase
MSGLESASAILLWGCLGLVAYTYILYAPLIWACAKLFGKVNGPPSGDQAELPSVSLLIAAHDEEAVIDARIRNALASDYPKDEFEIVIGSDGSTDRTAEIVSRYASDGVRLLDYKERRGKAAVLNASIREVRGDVVLLSDANTEIDARAVRSLARWFADPDVGTVCGTLVIVDPVTGRNADGLYWKYETFLKRCESRLGALLGSNGAIYAIRRDRYVPIRNDTIVDDFVIPLLSHLAHGSRILYDSEAVAREESAPDVRAEFRRRVRIGAGGFQSIGILWPLLNPRHGWTAFAFLSHKILRWLCPFFLLGALAANCLLLGLRGYRVTMACQVGFYVLSLAAPLIPGNGIPVRLLRLSTMFTSMNVALALGFFRWIRGRQKGTWSRTARLVKADTVAD